MRTQLPTIAIVAALFTALAAPARALDVGERLPALANVAWLGEPVDPSGAFTVIDLWSPDNPACRAIMPRLTDLQRRHPEVRVIGIAAGDRGEVQRFVTAMGSRVGYAIGVVPALAELAPPVGAPSALLVDRSGNVLWWGDAMDVVEPLSRALSGTFVPVPLTPPPAVPAAQPVQPVPAAAPEARPQTIIIEHRDEPRVVVVSRPWSWSVDVCGPCISPIWLPRPPVLRVPVIVPPLLPPLPPLWFPRHHHR